jgi:protein-S-isoprenylcysteine O-methyltransferase Ste14
MRESDAKASAGLLSLLGILGAALFLPSWSFYYWQGWVCLAAFFFPSIAITFYLMKRDPELLKRRLKAGAKAEQEKSQKVIQSLTRIIFPSLFVFSALDHRFGWSIVPPLLSIAGDLAVALGFAVIFAVFRANTYTSGTIEVAAGQTVVSTGPYALVRHPMYSGALIMLFGIPPALGSWWGLLIFVPMAGLIVWRLLEEEKFLAANLPGYSEYRKRVAYRLLPLVW